MIANDPTDDIYGMKLPGGKQFEFVDKAAREAIAEVEAFDPMDNFEINDTINLIFG